LTTSSTKDIGRCTPDDDFSFRAALTNKKNNVGEFDCQIDAALNIFIEWDVYRVMATAAKAGVATVLV
jgi:hypothetical protein